MVSLLEMLPPIERLRGFRLYGAGRRFVDLWQCGGAAILGHKPVNVVRDLKNAAERGLFAPFPNAAARRFTKALDRLFPGKAFKVYQDWSAVPGYKSLPVWRPFCFPESGGVYSGETAAAFRPILPFPSAPAVIVCEMESEYPDGGFLPPFLLAAATRAIYDLLAEPERGIMRFKRIKDAFKQPLTLSNWRMDGIYIRPVWADAGEEWAKVFRCFLDSGFLLPPSPLDPLILPGELSQGEENSLANLLSLHAADYTI
ncbi:MAG: hypothetical protein LBF80_00105 [Spirochaetaceae bacterium]|jgi:hypothetical protein|nr:hypothetical protein [Spirochaetaceae bacterium]